MGKFTVRMLIGMALCVFMTVITAFAAEPDVSLTVPTEVNLTIGGDSHSVMTNLAMQNDGMPLCLREVEVTGLNGWELLEGGDTIPVNTKVLKLGSLYDGDIRYAQGGMINLDDFVLPSGQEQTLPLQWEWGVWTDSHAAEQAFRLDMNWERTVGTTNLDVMHQQWKHSSDELPVRVSFERDFPVGLETKDVSNEQNGSVVTWTTNEDGQEMIHFASTIGTIYVTHGDNALGGLNLDLIAGTSLLNFERYDYNRNDTLRAFGGSSSHSELVFDKDYFDCMDPDREITITFGQNGTFDSVTIDLSGTKWKLDQGPLYHAGIKAITYVGGDPAVDNNAIYLYRAGLKGLQSIILKNWVQNPRMLQVGHDSYDMLKTLTTVTFESMQNGTSDAILPNWTKNGMLWYDENGKVAGPFDDEWCVAEVGHTYTLSKDRSNWKYTINAGETINSPYYRIKNRETVESLEFMDTPVPQDAENVAELANDGSVVYYTLNGGKNAYITTQTNRQPTLFNSNSRDLFYGFKRLKDFRTNGLIDTSNTVHMDRMFQMCTDLETIDLSDFDTSNTLSMQNMFENCWALSTIDISTLNLDTTSMLDYMFNNCYSLKDIKLGSLTKDDSESMSGQGMFNNCESLEHVDFSQWNVRFGWPPSFHGCTSLKTMDISGWRIKKGAGSTYGGIIQYTPSLEWIKVSEKLEYFYYFRNTASGNTSQGVWSYLYDENDQKYAISGQPPIPVGNNTWYTHPKSVQYNAQKVRTYLTNWKTKNMYVGQHREVHLSPYYRLGLDGNFDVYIGKDGDNAVIYTLGDHTRGVKIVPNTLKEHFDNLPYLEHVYWDEKAVLDKPHLTDLTSLYARCPNLQSIEYLADQKFSPEVTTTAGMFQNSLSDQYGPLDLSCFSSFVNVENASSMFNGCKTDGFVGLNGLDVSGLSDAAAMFYGMPNITTLDFSGWNTQSLTRTAEMFKGCASLETINGLENWDMADVNNSVGMFENCVSLDGLQIANWDMSSNTILSLMFKHCESMTNIDISGWKLAPEINMLDMFAYCLNAEIIDLPDFHGSKTQMINGGFCAVFDHCEKVETLDLSGLDTSEANGTYDLFKYCGNLREVIGLEDLDMTNVQNVDSAFENCYLLPDFTFKRPPKNIKHMQKTFKNCVTMKNLDLSEWYTDRIINARNFDETFMGCSELETVDISGINFGADSQYYNGTFDGCVRLRRVSLGNNATYTKVKLPVPDAQYIDGADGKWYDSKGVGYEPKNVKGPGVFVATPMDLEGNGTISSAKLRDLILEKKITKVSIGPDVQCVGEHFDVSVEQNNGAIAYVKDGILTMSRYAGVDRLQGLFNGMSTLTSVGIFDPDGTIFTEDKTDLRNMFTDCAFLEEILGAGTWDMSHVTNISGMFFDCYRLDHVDGFENWDVSSLTDLKNAFYMTNFETMDLSAWKFSPETLYGTFGNMPRLKSLDISGMNLSALTNYQHMINGETVLEEIKFSGTFQEGLGSALVQMKNTYWKNLDTGERWNALGGTTMWPTGGHWVLDNVFTLNTQAMREQVNKRRIECVIFGSDAGNQFDGNIDLSINGNKLVRGCIYDDEPYTMYVVAPTNLPYTVRPDTLAHMFDGCATLKEIVVRDTQGFDVTGYDDASYMFANCPELITIEIPLDGILATAKSTSHMFTQTVNVDYGTLLADGLSMPECVDASGMFDGALTEPVDIQVDMPKVQNASVMFANNEGLTGVSLSGMQEVRDMSSMFLDCPNLTSFATIDCDMSNLTNIKDIFNIKTAGTYDAVMAIDRDLDLTDLETWNVTANLKNAADSIIYGSNTSLDLSGWDISGITGEGMRNMLGCNRHLETVTVPDALSPDLTSLKDLFTYDVSLKSVNGLENWDTSNINNFRGIFFCTESLETVDLSGWDLSGWNVDSDNTFHNSGISEIIFGDTELPAGYSLRLSGIWTNVDTGDTIDFTAQYDEVKTITAGTWVKGEANVNLPPKRKQQFVDSGEVPVGELEPDAPKFVDSGEVPQK